MPVIASKKTHIIAIIFASLCYSTFLWWQQDDFYIHLQYAKNFSETCIWAFNRGVPSYGTTSPLWILLLSFFGAFRINLIIVAKTLSLLMGVLTFYILVQKARAFSDRIVIFLFALSLGINHWYRLAAGCGMEATLASFCVTILFLRTYETKRDSFFCAVTGFLSGLCVLVRPEFIYVAIIIIAGELLRRESGRERLSHTALIIAGILAAVLPWAVFAELQLQSLIPTTVLVKTGNHLDPGRMFEALKRIVLFYASSSSVELVLAAVFLASVLRGKIHLGNDVLVRCGLTAGIPLLYFVNHAIGGASISYRYAAPTIPIMIFAAYKFLDFSLNKHVWRSPIHSRALYLSLAVCIALPNIWLSWKHTPFLMESNAYLAVLEKYGSYLKDHSSVTDTVACHDVGAIGYYSDRYVLDLIGLVSPETIRYQHEGDQYNVGAIEAFRPRYLVVPWYADKYHQRDLFPAGITIFADRVYDYRFQALQPSDDHPYQTELRMLR